jgi:predicted MFS family arabinose efflux permease
VGVSVGTGGLMVVVPAVAAAVAAPLLTLCSARLERRAVLVGLSALVLVSDLTRWWPSGAWATGRSR